MRIKKFKIVNYRAIEEIELNLSFSINPIIGVNESGKTSVLKAILAFDKNRDKLNKGEHLEFKNKYSNKQNQDCQIESTIELDKNELTNLIKNLKLKTDSEDYNIVKKFNQKTEFILTRHLTQSGNFYSYNNELISAKTCKGVAKFLESNLPFILYFDDFSDRVPDEIQFPQEYRTTGKLGRTKIREWQEIIEEIFKRVDTEGIEDEETPLQTYLNIKDNDTKTNIKSDIEDELNNQIIKEWKRIKKSGKSFADDSSNLDLLLEEEEDGTFAFKVRDKSKHGKRRIFNIGNRSKGFQWFFNYMIKLKFNPNYKKKLEDSIFLLDEPGSYLHSAAQIELLNELKRVSKDNTIIYCTHSQYLLNPSVIQLGSIKIAEKLKSKINLQPYGNYKGKKDKSALSPIYQALQLNFAHDFVGKIVITEGITDYYLFSILQSKTNIVDKSFKFIPSAGASQSSTLISLAIPFSDNFVVFLDNDKAGKDAYKKYAKEFGEHIENKLFRYQSSKSKFELEDYLSEQVRSKLLEITKTTSVKRALGFLFYDYASEQIAFVSSFDNETKSNFEEITIRLKQLN